jgi:CheY-like chemotaxis protein
MAKAWSKHQGNSFSDRFTRLRETSRTNTPEFGGRGIRVLVVEDNVVNQKVAGLMLEKLGLHVDFAGNGVEALRMCAEVAYSMIFMDCQMPQMDGYTAAREIRARARGGWRVPIVAMTAEAMAGARESCLAAGMDDYIAKPVQRGELGNKVAQWALSSAPVVGKS